MREETGEGGGPVARGGSTEPESQGRPLPSLQNVVRVSLRQPGPEALRATPAPVGWSAFAFYAGIEKTTTASPVWIWSGLEVGKFWGAQSGFPSAQLASDFGASDPCEGFVALVRGFRVRGPLGDGGGALGLPSWILWQWHLSRAGGETAGGPRHPACCGTGV